MYDFASLDDVESSRMSKIIDRALPSMSPENLRANFDSLNLPAFGANSSDELKERLKQWFDWNDLSEAEIRQECSKFGGSDSVLKITRQSASRDNEKQMLLAMLVASAWLLPAGRRLSLPLHQVEDASQVLSLAYELEQYQRSTKDELLRMYAQLGLPEDPGLRKDELLNRLQLLLIWESLPDTALWKECQDRNLVLGDSKPHEERQALLQRLLTHLIPNLCSLAGVSVERYASIENATDVARQISAVQAMSVKELQQCCKDWMILLPDTAAEEQYVYCLQCAISWFYLPISELVKECGRLKMSTDKISGYAADEDRETLLAFLLCSFSGAPVERFDTPESAFRVGQQWLDISYMSLTEMQQQCNEWELPIDFSLSEDELRTRMRLAALWWELPLPELVEECKKIQVSFAAKGTQDEKTCTLLLRLLHVLCRETFEGLVDGIEHVDGLEAAARLQHQCTRLDGMDVRALKLEYESFGLQSQSLTPKDFIERLKKIFLWMELPLPVLQNLCREWNCNSIAISSKELAPNFARFCWNDPARNQSWQRSQAWEQRRQANMRPRQPPLLTRPKSQPTAGPAKFVGYTQAPYVHSRPKSQPTAGPAKFVGYTKAPRMDSTPKHVVGVSRKQASDLAILELPHSAGREDVKRAFHRLALKHHPDKDPKGAREFIAINGAYSALMQHFKK